MISIVIPNYNGNCYLKQCLSSIQEQEYKNYEIIFVDNASTDGSYKWVEEKANIKFVQLDKNYGFSYAVNKGIKMAQGEYVLLLNNDTKLCKGFLQEMLNVIQKNQKIFAVSSRMLRYQEPEKIDDAGDQYTLLGWAYKRGDGKLKEKFNKGKKIFSACGGAALYRKKIFEEIGCFDEQFFAYMEDIDIGYRANIYGYYNVYAPKAEVLHIGSAASGSRYNEFKARLVARNNIFVTYKNMPLVQIIINSPFLFIGHLIKYTFYVHKGLGKFYRASLWEGCLKLKEIKKIPFKIKHIPAYCNIQIMLIKNMFEMLKDKIK